MTDLTVRLVNDFTNEMQHVKAVIAEPAVLRTSIQRLRSLVWKKPSSAELVLKQLQVFVAERHKRMSSEFLPVLQTRIEDTNRKLAVAVELRRDYVWKHHEQVCRDLAAAFVNDVDAWWDEFCQVMEQSFPTSYDTLRIFTDIIKDELASLIEKPAWVEWFLKNQAEVNQYGKPYVCIRNMKRSYLLELLKARKHDVHEWIYKVPDFKAYYWYQNRASWSFYEDHASLYTVNHVDPELAMLNTTIYNFRQYIGHIERIRDSMTKSLGNLETIETRIGDQRQQIRQRARRIGLYTDSVALVDTMIDEASAAMKVECEIRDFQGSIEPLLAEIALLSTSMLETAIN